jgi:hypothetical protein
MIESRISRQTTYGSEIVFCASAQSKYARMKEIAYNDVENLPMALPHTENNICLPNQVMFIAQADVLRSVVETGEVYSVLPRDVADGWQRQYENRTKGAKKAGIDAKKAAIRSEDISKGVFVPMSNLPKKEPRKAERKTAALPMAANQ